MKVDLRYERRFSCSNWREVNPMGTDAIEVVDVVVETY